MGRSRTRACFDAHVFKNQAAQRDLSFLGYLFHEKGNWGPGAKPLVADRSQRRSVKKTCQWQVFSVGHACFTGMVRWFLHEKQEKNHTTPISRVAWFFRFTLPVRQSLSRLAATAPFAQVSLGWYYFSGAATVLGGAPRLPSDWRNTS